MIYFIKVYTIHKCINHRFYDNLNFSIKINTNNFNEFNRVPVPLIVSETEKSKPKITM
jgi:hypothetical protein